MNKKTRKIIYKNKKFKGGSSLLNRMGLSRFKHSRRVIPINNPLINSANKSSINGRNNSENYSSESANSSDSGNNSLNSENNGNKKPIQLVNSRVIETGSFNLLSGEIVHIIESGTGLAKRFFEFPYIEDKKRHFDYIKSVVINGQTVQLYQTEYFLPYILYDVDKNKISSELIHRCFIYLAKKTFTLNGQTYYIKLR